MKRERTDRVVVRVPSDLRYGEAARAMIDALSKRIEAETESVGLNSQVISAFNEAFNNVIEHAYRGVKTEEVEIRLTLEAESLVIDIIDGGQAFDIDSVDEPDLDAMPEGGLGIWIIRSFMSDVAYRCEGGKNILTMTKTFNQPLSLTLEPQQEF